MPDKPTTALGYTAHHLELVRATTLYVATKLGDLIDELVIIGGLVPSLLIDSANLPFGAELHVGTRDLDLGLMLTLFDHSRYRELTDRLRRAGFTPDLNDQGNLTRQRWKIEHAGATVAVDFLIPPSLPGDRGFSPGDQKTTIRNIEPDFAAIIAPGLHLAFRDRLPVSLSGKTLFGEKATRTVWVAGPGAYVVLKTLTFVARGENKDAYDLAYVVRNYRSGPSTIAEHLQPLLDDPCAMKALEILQQNFCDREGLGPCRVSFFLFSGQKNIQLQADTAGLFTQLVELCSTPVPNDEP